MTPSLRPYQTEAAGFLTQHPLAMVLAKVGAGKTALTIRAMETLGGRWLVLAPKRVATEVWPQELEKWRTPRMTNLFTVTLTNYERIHQLDSLKGFDGVVFDELTRLKDPSGKRFKMLEKLLKESGVKYRWGLTGSFTSNGLEDVFGQCKIVDQSLLGRAKGAFLQQYFICINREWGEWTPAEGALEQVMARIKPATFVLENSAYADGLPPLHVVPVPCTLGARKPYEDMRKQYVAEFAGKEITALSAAAVTNKLQQMASGFVYDVTKTPNAKPGKYDTYRASHWYSDHKFDRLEELLQENQRTNTIIFYTYQEEFDELRRRYPSAASIKDDGVIDKWNAGKVEILLAHPKSAGHGLNLQYGGSTIVFLSPPWSLELYEQAIGRLHRSGQTKPVWVYVMMTTKTIDERIFASLHDKRSVSDVALEELRA